MFACLLEWCLEPSSGKFVSQISRINTAELHGTTRCSKRETQRESEREHQTKRQGTKEEDTSRSTWTTSQLQPQSDAGSKKSSRVAMVANWGTSSVQPDTLTPVCSGDGTPQKLSSSGGIITKRTIAIVRRKVLQFLSSTTDSSNIYDTTNWITNGPQPVTVVY